MRRLWLFVITLVLGVVLCTGTAVAATPHFTAAAPMITARGYFSAVKLLNGNVLVAGGYSGVPGPPLFFADAEIYHPGTGTWSPAAPMNVPRSAAAAVRLPDGKVLVAGGTSLGPTSGNTAEIYDPTTGKFSPPGP